jgi:hypothetical protein
MTTSSNRRAATGIVGFAGNGWYAQGEQVRTLDAIIDWLRELWRLRDVFAAHPAMATLLV